MVAGHWRPPWGVPAVTGVARRAYPWSPATAVFGSISDSAAHMPNAAAAYGPVWVNVAPNA